MVRNLLFLLLSWKVWHDKHPPITMAHFSFPANVSPNAVAGSLTFLLAMLGGNQDWKSFRFFYQLSWWQNIYILQESIVCDYLLENVAFWSQDSFWARACKQFWIYKKVEWEINLYISRGHVLKSCLSVSVCSLLGMWKKYLVSPWLYFK